MSCDKCNEERVKHIRFCRTCGADLSIPNGGAPCDYCSRSKALGHRFCNVCGRDLSNDPDSPEMCSQCETYRSKGYRYCAVCGRPLGNVYPHPYIRPEPKVSFILMSISVLTSMFILAYEAFTGVVKLPVVMEGLEGHTYSLFILAPHVVDIVEIGHVGMRFLYVLELGIVLICIGYLFYSAFLKYKESDGDKESLCNTGLYEVICLNGVLFIFQFVYVMLCGALGTETSPIDFPDVAISMFALLNASVYEEFLCRILMIGLPVLVVYLIKGDRKLPAYRYLLGGFEFKNWMWIPVLVSAIVFGIGHISGWGLWKLVPTTLFGLLTAYIFIKYGVYATISIHFLTDFLMSETWLTGTNLPIMLTLLLLASAIMALGSIPFYYRKIRGAIQKGSTKSGS